MFCVIVVVVLGGARSPFFLGPVFISAFGSFFFFLSLFLSVVFPVPQNVDSDRRGVFFLVIDVLFCFRSRSFWIGQSLVWPALLLDVYLGSVVQILESGVVLLAWFCPLGLYCCRFVAFALVAQAPICLHRLRHRKHHYLQSFNTHFWPFSILSRGSPVFVSH